MTSIPPYRANYKPVFTMNCAVPPPLDLGNDFLISDTSKSIPPQTRYLLLNYPSPTLAMASIPRTVQITGMVQPNFHDAIHCARPVDLGNYFLIADTSRGISPTLTHKPYLLLNHTNTPQLLQYPFTIAKETRQPLLPCTRIVNIRQRP